VTKLKNFFIKFKENKADLTIFVLELALEAYLLFPFSIPDLGKGMACFQ
jgi:hypothetical protein